MRPQVTERKRDLSDPADGRQVVHVEPAICRRRALSEITLPSVEAVDALPLKTLPAFLAQLAALQTRAAARLHRVGTEREENDLACLDVNEVARRLKCSVDLVRERGDEWGIARVLARKSDGTASRVVYPCGLLRDFLVSRPIPTRIHPDASS